MKNLRKYSGFTLIELLVVIAIIGILAAVVLVSLSSARAKARDSRRVSDIHQMQTALELFYNDCGAYPATLATTATSGTCASTVGTFLPTLPVPPTGCTATGGATTVGSATTYGYTFGTPTNAYTLFFCSEGPIGGSTITASGNHTATPGGLVN